MEKYIFFIILCIIFIYIDNAFGYQCDVVYNSYNLCESDPICKRSMYIDENGHDMDTFEFLFRWVVSGYNLETEIDNMLCNENENENVLKMWVHMMSRYTYCHNINEYYDKDIGCICRSDKSCEYKSPKTYLFSFSENRLLSWAIISALIIGIIITWHRIDEVYKFLAQNYTNFNQSQSNHQNYSHSSPSSSNSLIVPSSSLNSSHVSSLYQNTEDLSSKTLQKHAFRGYVQ